MKKITCEDPNSVKS